MPDQSWDYIHLQRQLTVEFLRTRKINAAAIWLNPESSSSTADDARKDPETLNCPSSNWLAEGEERNLGLRLSNGHIELKIRSPDDVWAKCFFAACDYLHVDARAAYGPLSGPIKGVILYIADQTKIERWRTLWPRGHKDKAGAWVEAEFAYSQMPTPKVKTAVYVNSAPLPGSRFANDLIVWRPKGKPAAEDYETGLEDLEAYPLNATSMESICRAIAFATLVYWVQVYLDGLEDWDESLTRALGGWLARQVGEGAAINQQGKSLEGKCWAPVDSADTADLLLRFLQQFGASGDLRVSYEQAQSRLERDAKAPIAGWPSLETLFGAQGRVGIRRAFRAGIDIDLIEQMSDQYVYDLTEHSYHDLDLLLKGVTPYSFSHDDLVRQWANQPVFINGKAVNGFRIFATSAFREDIVQKRFAPGYAPGAILRVSPVHGYLNGEDRQPDEYRVLNSFHGFPVKPIATIDPGVWDLVQTTLDHLFSHLTRGNVAQMTWLKKFIAHIAQCPQTKPQVCPVLVGGQGIGKSTLGKDLMHSLFGVMASNVAAGNFDGERFLVESFIGKIIVTLDEVRLESVAVINGIKNMVRTDTFSGQEKFKHAREYFLPARLMITSNHVEIGLTPEDAADRTLFFILGHTAESMGMLDSEFNAWTNTQKPFFDRLIHYLKNDLVFRQHLMRYFMDVKVERHELEDLTYSSRYDESVIRASMPKAREIARAIIADARVIHHKDIVAPFTHGDVVNAIKRHDDRKNKVEASQVILEWRRAKILEDMKVGGGFRFLYGYGKLCREFGAAHNLVLHPSWQPEPGRDWEDNKVLMAVDAPPWRGKNGGNTSWNGNWRSRNSENPDPDYEPPF